MGKHVNADSGIDEAEADASAEDGSADLEADADVDATHHSAARHSAESDPE
ncbi:MAG TPA: hypothetical protein VGM38_05990 [Pseudolysinimonas sp.]